MIGVFMASANSNNGTAIDEYPKVFVKNIVFNDGTVLSLNRCSMVVFTGANNSGKSQVLRDVEKHFDESTKDMSVVIADLEYEIFGDIAHKPFFDSNFFKNRLC